MSENPPESSTPLDVQTVHKLVRMMKRYDLTAIDYMEGETTIRLRRRGSEITPVGWTAVPTAIPTPPGPAVPVAAASAATPPEPTPAPTGDVVIESPMVGTYYASPAPDAPPFVSVGASVRPDSTVCVIEAMKVFTDIPANVAGTITEILVKNGQSVEFGQPLFRVKTS